MDREGKLFADARIQNPLSSGYGDQKCDGNALKSNTAPKGSRLNHLQWRDSPRINPTLAILLSLVVVVVVEKSRI